jgi:hypothetical protein
MRRPPNCRRKHDRFPLDASRGGTIEFSYPGPAGAICSMPLHDLSRAGLSFVLSHELPGLEIGDSLDGARIRVNGREVRGDLLVMRLTPDDSRDSVCGGLFYPVEDADILAMRAIIAELEVAELAHAAER